MKTLKCYGVKKQQPFRGPLAPRLDPPPKHIYTTQTIIKVYNLTLFHSIDFIFGAYLDHIRGRSNPVRTHMDQLLYHSFQHTPSPLGREVSHARGRPLSTETDKQTHSKLNRGLGQQCTHIQTKPVFLSTNRQVISLAMFLSLLTPK